MSVTIYHNPACGTSRNTLAMIRQSGEEPEVIEYLKNPPGRASLIELIKAMRISVRALLREKGTPYAELGLADPKWSDDQLIDFMLAHPILINRPIVVTPKGAKLCRPSEAVLDLLDNPADTFVKEDGETVTRANRRRCSSGVRCVLRIGFGPGSAVHRTGRCSASPGVRCTASGTRDHCFTLSQMRSRGGSRRQIHPAASPASLSSCLIARHNISWSSRPDCS